MWCIWDAAFSMDINLVNSFFLKNIMTFSQRPTSLVEHVNSVMDVSCYKDSICYHLSSYIC
jgi:hypothetical protein